ncbi:MAG: DUF4349 domain-containing protein [Ruminococcus sp.]|nr:DUF4349 domain-containing protein [Candidatus Apopatosoma intestinale]
MKKLFALLLAACIALSLCACGAASDSSFLSVNKSASGAEGWYADGTSDVVSYNESYSEKDETPVPSSGNISEVLQDVKASEASRKVIKRAYLELESKKYDDALRVIKAQADALGGYVSDMSERMNYSSRYITMTVRVPAEKLDEYITAVGENCNVLSNRLTSEDITDSYYNIKSRMDSLVDQEERLNALIAKADTLDYLIKLENALADVRSQINQLNYQLQIYDKSVSYSFVTLSLHEVIEYQDVSEPTFWQKIGRAFTGGFKAFGSVIKGLAIGITWALPFLAIAAVILVLILIGGKKRKAKKASEYDDEKE